MDGQGLERAVGIDFFAEHAGHREVTVIDLNFLFLLIENSVAACFVTLNCQISGILRIFQCVKHFSELHRLTVIVQEQDIIAFGFRFFIRRNHGNVFPGSISLEVQCTVNAAPVCNLSDCCLQFFVMYQIIMFGIIRKQMILTAAHLNQIKFQMFCIIPDTQCQTGKRQLLIDAAVNDLIVIRFRTQLVESRNRFIERHIRFKF